SIRERKLFIYPREDSELLNQNIEALFSMKKMDNFSQNKYLLYLLSKKLGIYPSDIRRPFTFKEKKSRVFVFNTEKLMPEVDRITDVDFKIEQYVGPCAGILEFAK